MYCWFIWYWEERRRIRILYICRLLYTVCYWEERRKIIIYLLAYTVCYWEAYMVFVVDEEV